MKDWTKVYQSLSAHQVAIAKALLSDRSIEAVIVNKQDSINTYLNTSMVIELFVKSTEALTALHIIKKAEI